MPPLFATPCRREVFDGEGLNREVLLPSVARLAEASAAERPDNGDTETITDEEEEEEDSGSEQGEGGSGEREVVPFVLGARARQSREPRAGPPPPAAVIALCADRFQVVKGDLIKVPNYFCRRVGAGFSVRPLGSFAPPSLGSFSWPTDMWALPSGCVGGGCSMPRALHVPQPRGTHFSIISSPS